jgi:hypothetical protein
MKATTNRCLKAIRAMEKAGDQITSMALRDALQIPATARSTALDVAAGWISTLRRYGFLRVAKGVRAPGPARSLQVYELTDWGHRYKAGKQVKAQKPGLRIAANPPDNQG